RQHLPKYGRFVAPLGGVASRYRKSADEEVQEKGRMDVPRTRISRWEDGEEIIRETSHAAEPQNEIRPEDGDAEFEADCTRSGYRDRFGRKASRIRCRRRCRRTDDALRGRHHDKKP